MEILAIGSFVFFTALVAVISWWKTRGEALGQSSGYFLAGRHLGMWTIAGSLMLTNISTEQMVGLNGSAYIYGTSVMAWEVIAAIALVLMAVFFLPRYLKRGITTVQEYVADRFGPSMQSFLGAWFILLSVLTVLPFVLATGALALSGLFDVGTMLGISQSASIWMMVFLIAIVGGIYSIFGGLKAVAVSDTINGVGLLIGGLMIPVLGLIALGEGSLFAGIQHLAENAPERLSPMATVADDPFVPFSTIFTGMIWINVSYWCTNQFIIQRTFGASSLAEGQKGVLLAAVLKLVGTLMLVLPGIIAWHLLGPDLETQDLAYPQLVQAVLPNWLVGFFGAVLFGAILSSFNSALHSVSTSFSVDLYKPLFRTEAGERETVIAGKIFGALMVVVSCVIAPLIVGVEGGIFAFMKEISTFVGVPISAVIIAGIFLPRISATAAYIAFPVSVAIQAYFGYYRGGDVFGLPLHWLHLAAANFVFTLALMGLLSLIWPNRRPKPVEESAPIAMIWWKGTLPASALIVAAVIALYGVLSTFG